MYQKTGGLLSEVYIHKHTETTYKYLNDIFLLVGMTCVPALRAKFPVLLVLITRAYSRRVSIERILT